MPESSFAVADEILAAQQISLAANLLAGRVVLVTGGGSGIGRTTAWIAARLGAQVVICGRKPEKLDAVARAIGARGLACEARPLDIRDRAAVDALVADVHARHGRLDLLVNSAGGQFPQDAIEFSDKGWRAVIDTNLTATFRVVRRTLKRMIRQRSGRIVVISSIGALMGLPGQANYAASKAGLIGMARAIAREVASRGITVNVIAPGLIETDMTSALGPERLDLLATQVPAGRLGTPDEVADAAVFLASSSASYITGAILAIDGGLGMGL